MGGPLNQTSLTWPRLALLRPQLPCSQLLPYSWGGSGPAFWWLMFTGALPPSDVAAPTTVAGMAVAALELPAPVKSSVALRSVPACCCQQHRRGSKGLAGIVKGADPARHVWRPGVIKLGLPQAASDRQHRAASYRQPSHQESCWRALRCCSCSRILCQASWRPGELGRQDRCRWQLPGQHSGRRWLLETQDRWRPPSQVSAQGWQEQLCCCWCFALEMRAP